MNEEQRHDVMDQLAASQNRLLALVRPLSPAQWSFRESPERWSIAEIVEHLALFENFILDAVAAALEGTADRAKHKSVAEKDTLIMSLPYSRVLQIDAREAVMPMGQPNEKVELMKRLDALRTRSLAFATMTEAPLHDHFFPHLLFGDLNCRQWLLLLSQHTLRHIFQIEDIQKDLEYPAE